MDIYYFTRIFAGCNSDKVKIDQKNSKISAFVDFFDNKSQKKTL